MPTNYDDPATWDKVYGKTRPRTEPYISDYEWRQPDGSWGDFATRVGPPYTRRSRDIVGYSRAWALNFGGFNDALDWHIAVRDALLAAFPAMDPADRFFFVGCGFGFLVEVFRDAGFTNAWGIEPSAYIQGNKVTETRGDVVLVNESLTSGNALLNAMRNATGSRTADWVIDDEVLLGYTDAEITEVVANPSTRFVDLFEYLLTGNDQSRIVHLVRQGVSVDPEVIRRPMATWQAFDPAHSWFDVEAF